MWQEKAIDPTIIVVFGASGDLTARKVIPALYNLFLDGFMPDKFSIVGISRSEYSDDEFREQLCRGIHSYSRRKVVDAAQWAKFASRISYVRSDYDDATLYKKIISYQIEGTSTPNFLFYLATPPSLFPIITAQLGHYTSLRGDEHYRIVVEKPFGRDLESAQKLNLELDKVFKESQIFRIDHYLGKETVQNILAFRFANALWEPVWNRNYIDHIQITVAENIGIGARGGYYKSAGALRDMVQNHLFQLLCLIAMEPPTSFDADEIRNKKIDVLNALREISPQDVPLYAVRGQYGAGFSDGKAVKDYRAEAGVDPDSNTVTFVALKLFIDNWRWQGVPFYLRTGKHMPAHVSEISLQFRPVPHHPFSHLSSQHFENNRLVIQIAPTEGVVLRTLVKEPGLGMKLDRVDMRYAYDEVFHMPSPDAYETLLVDVLRNDPGLFMRADQVEIAWAVLDPILKSWEQNKEQKFPNYTPGQWGPQDAERLIAQDRRTWLLPICLEPKGKGGK